MRRDDEYAFKPLVCAPSGNRGSGQLSSPVESVGTLDYTTSDCARNTALASQHGALF